jgi:hypothetical protein
MLIFLSVIKTSFYLFIKTYYNSYGTTGQIQNQSTFLPQNSNINSQIYQYLTWTCV